MLSLGTKAPSFSLPDFEDKPHSIHDFSDAKALVVVFFCNHCPYIKLLKQHLSDFAREYQSKGVAFAVINSNDTVQYPDDAPEKMAADAKAFNYPFPYLVDERQEVAKTFQAACTPDFYLFDGERRLVYRGQYDDARPGNGIEPTGDDLAAAINAVLEGREVSSEQKPATGCNIKWKPGNSPDYFG